MNTASQQQVFNLQLTPANTFATFYTDPDQPLIGLLQSIANGETAEPQILLWGAANAGKTHLLQAVCHAASLQQRRSIFIPLAKLNLNDPSIIHGFEAMDIVCIDDIHLLAQEPQWEQSLFKLINEMREKKTTMVFSSEQNPTQNIFDLPDLNSRAVWGPVYKLSTLDEDQLEAALDLHAKSRGMELSIEVKHYLFTHYQRDATTLVSILEVLDHASLQEQRKVTVPFLKKILAT